MVSEKDSCTDSTALVRLCSTSLCCAVVKSHVRTVVTHEPVTASRVPSKAPMEMELSLSVCPRSTAMGSPPRRGQTIAVVSVEAVATTEGCCQVAAEKATPVTLETALQ